MKRTETAKAAQAKPRAVAAGRPVVIQRPGQKNAEPAESFNMCPLGMQFYSAKPMREFDLFEFNIEPPDAKSKPITCTGAVVRCQKEATKRRYRVWIQFVDLPKNVRERIHCTSKDGKHLCCYCENF